MPPKPKKKSPYQFFGAPKYDPRKENRTFLKAGTPAEAIAKIKAFVETALLNKASVIEIRVPGASTKPGQYELYCDAGVDAKKLKAAPRRKTGAKKR